MLSAGCCPAIRCARLRDGCRSNTRAVPMGTGQALCLPLPFPLRCGLCRRALCCGQGYCLTACSSRYRTASRGDSVRGVWGSWRQTLSWSLRVSHSDCFVRHATVWHARHRRSDIVWRSTIHADRGSQHPGSAGRGLHDNTCRRPLPTVTGRRCRQPIYCS